MFSKAERFKESGKGIACLSGSHGCVRALAVRGNASTILSCILWPLSFCVAPTAPPVGSYDVGGQDSNAGAVSFHKASRFKSDGSGTYIQTYIIRLSQKFHATFYFTDCGDGSFADDSLLVPATPVSLPS